MEVRKGARPNDHDGSFLQQLADGPELLIRVTEDAGQHDQSATPAYLVEMRPDRIRTDHCPIGHPDSSLLDDIRSALHDICVHINCDASSKSAHSGASMQPVHLPKAAFDAKARRAGMLMYRFLFGGSSTYCKAGLSDQATTSDHPVAPLRLTLQLPPALEDIPWELLCRPQRKTAAWSDDDFLALHGSIRRLVELDTDGLAQFQPIRLGKNEKLHVYRCIAAPKGKPKITDPNWLKLKTHGYQIFTDDHVNLDYLTAGLVKLVDDQNSRRNPWLSRLLFPWRGDRESRNRHCGFFSVIHGEKNEDGKGVLVLHDAAKSTRQDHVTIDRIREAFDQERAQRKVALEPKPTFALGLLLVCHSASYEAFNAAMQFQDTLAAGFLRHFPTPFVVAVHGRLRPESSWGVAATLFNKLATGERTHPVDVYLTQARRNLAHGLTASQSKEEPDFEPHLREPIRQQWWKPRLYISREGLTHQALFAREDDVKKLLG